jgi:protein farnesyltransferase subunit beta
MEEGGEVAQEEGPLLPGPLFHRDALQLWILRCCQVPGRGGLRDKPGKSPDYYHSCYCLSGLSSAQHGCSKPGGVEAGEAMDLSVFGPGENRLVKTDFLCNVVESKLKRARELYSASPL